MQALKIYISLNEDEYSFQKLTANKSDSDEPPRDEPPRCLYLFCSRESKSKILAKEKENRDCGYENRSFADYIKAYSEFRTSGY